MDFLEFLHIFWIFLFFCFHKPDVFYPFFGQNDAQCTAYHVCKWWFNGRFLLCRISEEYLKKYQILNINSVSEESIFVFFLDVQNYLIRLRRMKRLDKARRMKRFAQWGTKY